MLSLMPSNDIVQYTSSSSHAINTYDVFVSFRGEDTRNNFTGFLFQALRRKGIDAFKDDEDLRKGESIAPELLQAIQGSRVFIVVFSKNYASSTWCLRELAEILNCVETSARRVIPIFYDVDPSTVRKQSGCYEKAFAEHEKRFREDKVKMEEVERWRKALTEMANLSGWDVRNKPQYEQIEEIVENIINILGPKISNLPRGDLVGMEARVEELLRLLCLGSVTDVRVVGISGMGGIGKTTLGRALYERICHQYDYHCFIDDVSKIYQDSSSLGLQKQLISQSLNEKNLEISNAFEGTCLVWSRLRNARALVVFDNVNEVEQLRMFTGNRDTLLRDCLGGGSRIIVVSRDEHILKTHGVDDVYRVQPLNEGHALQLFGKYAFKDNHTLWYYEMLADDVLSHAQGHPLAIKVIGSSLFGRNMSQWKSVLAKLKENKSKNIMDVLRISFDQLDEKEKEAFLDIACFYNDYDEIEVKEILNFRGFHPEDSIQVLFDKSLITKKDGRIYMHGLLVDLGRCIVREKSPKEPLKWSRLWTHEDLHNAMLKNEATENLEAIVVTTDSFWIHETRADGLSKIKHLKLLVIKDVRFSGSLSHLSNELGYLIWKSYPFECLPQSFEPHKLVELNLSSSSIQRLWKGTKLLPNLKFLDLSFSKKLVEMPDVAEALNLEGINLHGCIQLRNINPSIGLLRKLVFLFLVDCKSLVSLPNTILGLSSLKYLNVSGCTKLYKNVLLDEARNREHLKKLRLLESPIQFQSTLSLLKNMFLWPLDLLYPKAQRDSISCLLPSSPTLPCLRLLNLSFCNLVQIPDAIAELRCLEKLNLKGNNFVTLPNLKDLSRLYYLDLQHCKQFKYLPDLPSRTHLPSKFYMRPFLRLKVRSDSLFGWLNDHHYEAGLIIFNCPELVERERCISMSVSWMMQIFQATQQCKCLDASILLATNIQSIIPESEIPRWFNNQFVSMDNSIIIDPSPVTHDNNWIGVVCCAIFRLGNEYDVRFPNPTYLQFPRIPKFPVDLRKDPVIDQSDHMKLFYFRRQDFTRPCWVGSDTRKFISLKLRMEDIQIFHHDRLGYQKFVTVDVKKYGYRWVYEEDQQPNFTLMYGKNLTDLKRKFSVIEENR